MNCVTSDIVVLLVLGVVGPWSLVVDPRKCICFLKHTAVQRQTRALGSLLVSSEVVETPNLNILIPSCTLVLSACQSPRIFFFLGIT